MMNIICFSTQLWEDPQWTNKQHVMSRLIKRRHRVLYVDCPIRFLAYLKGILKLRIKGLRAFTCFKKVKEGPLLLSPVKFLPFYDKEGVFREAVQKIYAQLIRLIIRQYKFRDPILWIYHPEHGDFIDLVPHRFVIYDCVDEYSQFPVYQEKNRKKWILEKELKLLEKADLVFTSTKILWEEKRKFNKRAVYIPNAADFEHNKEALDPMLKIPDDIKNIPYPIIGFQGAISSYKVNLKLLEKMAEARPNWSIVLIGLVGVADKKTDIKRLKKLSNVYFLGCKPYAQLPAYYKAFNVGTIPYNFNDYTLKGCFPLKFFEYLGGGLPVVTSDLPSLKEYKEVAYFAKNEEEFIEMTERALKEGKKKNLEKRLAVAEENSWDNKVKRQLKVIESWLRSF